jgi:hypothetical protein
MPADRSPKISPPESMGTFRAVVIIFAVLLACQAFWILVPELSRPPLIAFPHDKASAPNLTANHSAAHLAAQFAMVRGDLWAQDALTYGGFRGGEQTDGGDDVGTVADARNATERALLFAPHDARIWLALANIDSKFDRRNEKASAALRMSFYTGPNEVELIPARLQLALSLPAISDKDLQQLVTHDLRTIVTRRPELKPAISNAYQSASLEGQQFIQDVLKDLDPNLLSTLPQKRRGD